MKKSKSQLHIKILAVLSAVILWFIVITVENTVYPFPDDIEVEVSNLEKNLSLASDVENVKIYLQVDKEELSRLTENDFEVFVDLKNAETGEQVVPIIASSKNAQVKVLKVEPSEMNVKLSATTEKEVEVKVVVTGDPAQDYVISNTSAESEKVKISGAQSIIEEVEYVNAELILDGTEKSDMNQSVMLSLPEEEDIASDLIDYDPEQIVISVEITSQLQSKEVNIKPKYRDEGEEETWKDKVLIEPGKILIEGSEDDLAKISTIETEVFETGDLIRNGSIQVNPSLPEGVTLVNDSQEILIKVKESPEIGKEFQAAVKIQNGNDTLEASPSSVTVTLVGKEEAINAADNSQVYVTFSNEQLKEFDERTITVNHFTLPKGTKILNFNPDKITIKSNAPTI